MQFAHEVGAEAQRTTDAGQAGQPDAVDDTMRNQQALPFGQALYQSLDLNRTRVFSNPTAASLARTVDAACELAKLLSTSSGTLSGRCAMDALIHLLLRGSQG
eukprot:scaffold3990_cov394-Prasinococcus_capsulatus_cf.AAC.2